MSSYYFTSGKNLPAFDENTIVGIDKMPILTMLLYAILIELCMAIRGVGWDGDSIVNIAQFYKLIYPTLYGTPDGGTFPKLFPIITFGVFHALTGSYAIHLISIAISVYAIGMVSRLPAAFGGGPIWVVLPFLVPTWTNAILSADNAALAVGFSLLAIVDLINSRPNRAVGLLLMSEFARPGAFLIIALLLVLRLLPRRIGSEHLPSLPNPLWCLICFLLAIVHTAWVYRLGYSSYTDFVASCFSDPGLVSSRAWFKYDIRAFSWFLKSLMRGVLNLTNTALGPSFFGITLSNFVIIAGIIGWVAIAGVSRIKTLIIWLMITIPMMMIPVGAFLVGPGLAYSEYLIPATLPLLAGVARLASATRINRGWFLLLATFLAIPLAVHDGSILRGQVETNPTQTQSNASQSVFRLSDPKINWLSDPLTRSLLVELRQRRGRPLRLFASCDVVTLMIDVPDLLSSITIFAEQASRSDSFSFLMESTSKIYFLKRVEDVSLQETNGSLDQESPDAIYTS